MNKKTFLNFAGGALLSSAIAFSAVAQDSEPQYGGTLDVGFISDVRTLNPLQSTQWTERQILFLMFDRLVDMNPDFSLKPGLAKSWEFSDDGKQVVFSLEEGVMFHDGTPFNAEAVKWNLDMRLDPDGGSSQRQQLEGIIESVEVLDEYTVAVNMSEPYPPLLALFADRAGLMASPAAAEKYGEDVGSNPVGTGPFKFGSWTRGSELSLVRNEDFWQEGMPYLDGVQFNNISTNVVGIQRMTIGELDYIGHLTPLDTKLAEASDEIKLVQSGVGRWYSLQMNYGQEPYDSKALRQAISYGIDRERINEIVWEGLGQVTFGFTPDGLWWSPTDLPDYSYDPEKARQILKDAGLEGTKLSLASPSGDTLRRFSELVSENLNQIGLDVELAPVPQSEYYAKTVSGEINFTPMRWTQRADPDGLIQYLFSSEGTANSTGYSNPDVDAWIQQARTSTDQAERVELYQKAQMQIAEDLPYISVAFATEFSAMRENVHGYTPMPDLIPRFRFFWMDQE